MGKQLKKHLRICSDCLKARGLYLHEPIPAENSTLMRCGECRCYTTDASGENCLVYHCGKRESVSRSTSRTYTSQCECAHLDRLGNVLKINERCLIIPAGQPFTSELCEGEQNLMRLKDVRLDNFYMSGSVVEVRGKEDWRAEEPDTWELIGISYIISARALRRMGSLANYFMTHTLAKLLALRRKQPVAGCLRWSEIKRLSRVNAATNRIVILEGCNNVALARQLCS